MKRLLGLLLAMMVMMGGISCAVAENANPLVSDWLTELKSKRLIQIVEDEIGEGWTLYTSKKTDGTLEEEYIKSGTTSTGRIDLIYQYDPDVHMFWPLFKMSLTPNSMLANDYGYPVR